MQELEDRLGLRENKKHISGQMIVRPYIPAQDAETKKGERYYQVGKNILDPN